MRNWSRVLVAGLLLSGFGVGTVQAQSADSFVGKWEFNAAKAKGSVMNVLSAEAIREARPDGGETFHLSAKLKDGTDLTWDYTCTDDGKECPAKVSDGQYDTVSVKRVDANNVIRVMTKKGGKFKVTDTVTTSKDGKTMSGTKEGTDANGKQVSGAFFFDRK